MMYSLRFGFNDGTLFSVDNILSVSCLLILLAMALLSMNGLRALKSSSFFAAAGATSAGAIVFAVQFDTPLLVRFGLYAVLSCLAMGLILMGVFKINIESFRKVSYALNLSIQGLNTILLAFFGITFVFQSIFFWAAISVLVLTIGIYRTLRGFNKVKKFVTYADLELIRKGTLPDEEDVTEKDIPARDLSERLRKPYGKDKAYA